MLKYIVLLTSLILAGCAANNSAFDVFGSIVERNRSTGLDPSTFKHSNSIHWEVVELEDKSYKVYFPKKMKQNYALVVTFGFDNYKAHKIAIKEKSNRFFIVKIKNYDGEAISLKELSLNKQVPTAKLQILITYL